jgi:hypothetical protein
VDGHRNVAHSNRGASPEALRILLMDSNLRLRRTPVDGAAGGTICHISRIAAASDLRKLLLKGGL